MKKNLWSVLTLCHVHVFSIALEHCVQISHQAQVISKKEQDWGRWWKSLWQQDSSCLLFPSFRTLPLASKETKKINSLLSDTWAGAAVHIKRRMIQNGPEFHLEFFQSSRISQRLPTGASLALEEEEGEREEEGQEEEEDVPPTTADRRGKCYLKNRLAEVDQLSAFITGRIELGAHDCRKQQDFWTLAEKSSLRSPQAHPATCANPLSD